MICIHLVELIKKLKLGCPKGGFFLRFQYFKTLLRRIFLQDEIILFTKHNEIATIGQRSRQISLSEVYMFEKNALWTTDEGSEYDLCEGVLRTYSTIAL